MVLWTGLGEWEKWTGREKSKRVKEGGHQSTYPNLHWNRIYIFQVIKELDRNEK